MINFDYNNRFITSLKLTAFVRIVPYQAYINIWSSFTKAYVRNMDALIRLKSEN